MNKDALKQELEKKEGIIDALSAAIKVNKDAAKKLSAEKKQLKAKNKDLKSQEKQKDSLQQRVQSENKQLEIHLKETLYKLQWCSCRNPAAEKRLTSASLQDSLRNIHLGSDSYESFRKPEERQEVCDFNSKASDEHVKKKQRDEIERLKGENARHVENLRELTKQDEDNRQKMQTVMNKLKSELVTAVSTPKRQQD